MTKQKKLIVYGALLFFGLLVFILEVFVFQKPDGIVGLVICVTSMLVILGSTIKLCIISRKFQDSFFSALDLFFWLP